MPKTIVIEFFDGLIKCDLRSKGDSKQRDVIGFGR